MSGWADKSIVGFTVLPMGIMVNVTGLKTDPVGWKRTNSATQEWCFIKENNKTLSYNSLKACLERK